MEAKVQVITPELAKEYLEKNINNYRSMSNGVVAAYAADMKTGNWKFNGDSIKFNKSGFLVDGQHRLQAIIRSGVSIQMMVITGIEDDIATFDIGKNRTAGQIAKAKNLPSGVTNNATIGAVSMLLTWDRKSVVPKQKVIEILSEEPETWSDAYYACAKGADSAICRKAPIVLACYCLFKQNNNYDDVCSFFEVVNSGFQICGVECSPAIVLRNYILGEKYKKEFHTLNGRSLLFSSTLSAFRDFKAGSQRRKSYSLDPAHVSLLKELRRIAMGENENG